MKKHFTAGDLLSIIYLVGLVSIMMSSGCKESINQTFTDWDIVQINIPVPLIGDLRNDGIERSYAIEDGDLCEYVYQQQWIKTVLISNTFHSSELHLITRCQADQPNCLYGCDEIGIFEVQYSENTWTKNTICPLTDKDEYDWCMVAQSASGNEPETSLFIFYWTSGLGKLCELTNQGGNWMVHMITDTLNDWAPSPYGMAVGNVGRNSETSVFFITGTTNLIECFKESALSWKIEHVETMMELCQNCVICPWCNIGVFPSGDGCTSLFVDCDGLYQYDYQNEQWQKTKAGHPIGNQISGGFGRNDGIYRLYCYGWFGQIAEFTDNGGTYSQSGLLEIEPGNAINALTVGPGRGDGVHRLYIEQFNGSILELTYNK